MEIRKTAIVGMGALGMLYAMSIYDWNKDAVEFVMDADRVKRNQGKIRTVNKKKYCFPVCECENAEPADLVIVAVKYNGLESALDTMKNSVGKDTIIISVMNGISSEEIIRNRYPNNQVIDTVAQGMDAMRREEGLVYTQAGQLHLGIAPHCAGKAAQEALKAVSDYFDRTGIKYIIEDDIQYRMWCKFMLNVGINQTCMAYETNYSGCLDTSSEAYRTMTGAMREVIGLAGAEGISMGEKELEEYLDILRTLDPEGIPSMRQDSAAGRKSEVEMFAGTVIRMAEKHGIEVPANRFLYDRVKEIEAGYQI